MQSTSSFIDFMFDEGINFLLPASTMTNCWSHKQRDKHKLSPASRIRDAIGPVRNVKFAPRKRTAQGGVPRGRSRTPLSDLDDDKPLLLEKALSESAEQYPEDYIDPETYVKRSVEERQQKSLEEGKISRPLNSYMLYRKAYQQVARKVIRKDQQQSASQTVGTSWTKLEHDDVKSRFRALAKIDHQMHHKAFPSYKYTPTQGKNPRNSPESRKLPIPVEGQLTQQPEDQDMEFDLAISSTEFTSPTSEATKPLLSHEDSISWWQEEHQNVAAPFSRNGVSSHGYDAYLMPDSACFDSQAVDSFQGHGPVQLSVQIAQLAPGQLEGLGMENCIDPSLFSSTGSSSSPDSIRYSGWQPQESITSQGLTSFMSDFMASQPFNNGFPNQDIWPAEQVSERVIYPGWQASCRDNDV